MTDLTGLAEHPHRRRNALTGEWVLVSPHRTQRPWQGQVESARAVDAPRLRPRRAISARATSARAATRNPEYTGTFVFDNDFAALRPALRRPSPRSDDDLFVAPASRAVCRVICFSPRHDLTLAEHGAAGDPRRRGRVGRAVRRAGRRSRDRARADLREQGRDDGVQQPAPARADLGAGVDPAARRRARTSAQRAYHDRHGRTLLTDYLGAELRRDERIVCENDAFVALVPFWAVWPFETLVVARRAARRTSASSTTPSATGSPTSLQRLTRRYDNLFDVSFPYSAGIHQAPTDGRAAPGVAPAPALLSAAAALGHGAQVPGRLRAARRAAARPDGRRRRPRACARSPRRRSTTRAASVTPEQTVDPRAHVVASFRDALRRRAAAALARAPGRVNLIGEHTDYNDGFVLPVAIDRARWIAFRLRDDRLVGVESLDTESATRSSSTRPAATARAGSWVDYVVGVPGRCTRRAVARRAASRAMMSGDVPHRRRALVERRAGARGGARARRVVRLPVGPGAHGARRAARGERVRRRADAGSWTR